MAENPRSTTTPQSPLSEGVERMRKAKELSSLSYAEFTRQWNERQAAAQSAQAPQMLTVQQQQQLRQSGSAFSSSSSTGSATRRTARATAVRIPDDEVPRKLRPQWVLPADLHAEIQCAEQTTGLTMAEYNRQMAEKQKEMLDRWDAHVARLRKEKKPAAADDAHPTRSQTEEGEIRETPRNGASGSSSMAPGEKGESRPVQVPEDQMEIDHHRSQTEEGEIRETHRREVTSSSSVAQREERESESAQMDLDHHVRSQTEEGEIRETPKQKAVGSSSTARRSSLFIQPPNKRRAVASTSNSPSTSRPTSASTFTPAVKSVLSPNIPSSPLTTTPHTLLSPSTATPVRSEWWKAISHKSRRMHETIKDPEKRRLHATLCSFKDCISRCESLIQQQSNPAQQKADLDKVFNELRNHIHKAEFLSGIDEYVLARAHMLDNGLTRIFSPDDGHTVDAFPLDIKEDARQLYVRWCDKNFSIELLRGIIPSLTKDANRSADKLDPSFKQKYGRNANFYGQGDLALGQWWPTQLCTVRDGAHGSAQGGIFGEKGKGAFSVIVAGGGGYEDRDEGDVVFYCGTVARDGATAPTENTMRLIESCELPPVRLIRSANLPNTNPYRPERGYRYDGLYKVVSYEVLKQDGAVYRFKLVRCEGQGPIRCEGLGKRPTRWEVEAYDREVAERGFGLSEAANAR